MNSQPQTSIFVRAVDYLWDHKIRFLICVVACVFSLNASIVAYHSFSQLHPTSTGDILPLAEASSTDVTINADATTLDAQSSTSSASELSKSTNAVAVATPQKNTTSQVQGTTQIISNEEAPTRLVIARMGIDTQVANPTSTNINTLNDILTQKVVRYSGSGTMTSGNMLIMGHSSELPIIHNPMYKVFTQLKYLVAGDVITVYSSDHNNTYRVTSVKMLNTDDNGAYIPFNSETTMLTLLTCNVLGEKNDRYVVTAELVASN